MEKLRALWSKWRVKLLVSGRLDSYIPPPRTTEAASYRHPSPASQPASAIPETKSEYVYDIAYFKRGGVRVGLVPRSSEKDPISQKILPDHIPKPEWWYEQDQMLTFYTSKGYLCPPLGRIPPMEKQVERVWEDPQVNYPNASERKLMEPQGTVEHPPAI